MSEIVTYIDINSHSAKERLLIISAFMRVKAFPRKLRRRVRSYYKDLTTQNSAINMEFAELPRDLSREVQFFLVNNYVRKNKLFGILPDHIMAQILPLMRPIWFNDREVIIERGEFCSEIVIVRARDQPKLRQRRASLYFQHPVCHRKAVRRLLQRRINWQN